MSNPPISSSLLGPLFSSAAMRSVVDDRARLQRMLDFESALARAEAALGVIPAAAGPAVAAACVADRYDIPAIGEAAVAAGNIAIPLVKALTAEVAKSDAEAARYVHWGATSQDVIDTALVLELRAGIDALVADLDRAVTAFTTLTGRNRRTPTVARTWLQQALPMPFGLKLAGYAAALSRSRERLKRLRKEALLLQFGGAAGTLAALGERGLDVTERLAALLDLPAPEAPWHSHRDRLAEVAGALAILAGTCGKIARDVALLMQTEVGEAFEPAAPGRGGSSTMPHKRNPTAAAAALAAATIAPQLAATIFAAQVQEHERALGGWQAEWPTFPALMLCVSGGLHAIVDIAEGLEIDADRMRVNLGAAHGLVMAEAVSMGLAAKIGRADAHKLVEEASKKAIAEKQNLHDVLAADPRVTTHLNAADLAKLFEPMAYQGAAQTFIDRLIASINGRGSKRS
jgi:3-carboxy-cis,cis-muconate cycloisomerase